MTQGFCSLVSEREVGKGSWKGELESWSLKNYQYSTGGQTFHQNLAPVLVILLWNSPAFSRKLVPFSRTFGWSFWRDFPQKASFLGDALELFRKSFGVVRAIFHCRFDILAFLLECWLGCLSAGDALLSRFSKKRGENDKEKTVRRFPFVPSWRRYSSLLTAILRF